MSDGRASAARASLAPPAPFRARASATSTARRQAAPRKTSVSTPLTGTRASARGEKRGRAASASQFRTGRALKRGFLLVPPAAIAEQKYAVPSSAAVWCEVTKDEIALFGTPVRLPASALTTEEGSSEDVPAAEPMSPRTLLGAHARGRWRRDR